MQMKKHVVLSLILVSLTSCATYAQNSFVVDGKTYKTGFYKYYGNDLNVLGIKERDFSTSDFNNDKYHYWKLDNQRFDMYFAQHEEEVEWSPTIYCVSEQLKEAKEFYTDLDNYGYYIGEYDNEQSYVQVEDAKYYEAIEHAIKVMITKPFSRRQNKKIELADYQAMTLFRTSVDSLFTSTRDEFLYSEEMGFIYLAAYVNDSKDSVYYTLSKENNELLSELYQSLYQKEEN